MTLANFLSAIAQKLTGLWPDRLVYTGEIPQNADGQFFVGIIESGQEKRLDRRRTRTIQFLSLIHISQTAIRKSPRAPP